MPALCIGMELVRVHNFPQADQFLQQSQRMNPKDPLVWNELGVVALKERRFEESAQLFRKALQLAGGQRTAIWEATFSNLGHSLRRLRDYPGAKEAYRAALNLAPSENHVQAALQASLGLTSHLEGDLDAAILFYQQALGTEPGNRFALELLSRAISSIQLAL